MHLIFCPSSLYVFDVSFYFENNNNNNNNIMTKLSGVKYVNHDKCFFVFCFSFSLQINNYNSKPLRRTRAHIDT